MGLHLRGVRAIGQDDAATRNRAGMAEARWVRIAGIIWPGVDGAYRRRMSVIE